MKHKIDSLNFIDLFSGAGGLSCGLELAGLNCLLGVDLDKNALKTFLANHHQAEIFCDSISKLDLHKIKALTGSKPIHAVVGGPPCQGFSTAGLGDPGDKRNLLFKEFVRIVELTNPLFVVIENVTGLLAKKNEKTLSQILKIFTGLGYNLDCQVLSSEYYGVAERRRRTIIIGSKINQQILFPRHAEQRKTVGDVFSNLKNSLGSYYNHDLKDAEIFDPLDKKRLSLIPEGKGVRYQEDEQKYFKEKKLKLGVNWKELREGRFRQTKFQRLDRKKPGPTIMTSRYTYFHPTENRLLTPREAAAIQSFPNDFVFHGPISSQWKQIGNAVPPLLGKAIGLALIEMYKLQDLPHSMPAQKVKKSAHKSIFAIRKKAFIYKDQLTE